MTTNYGIFGNNTNSSNNTSNSNDAVARYQYLLSTASPQGIEKAHEEAFAAMSVEERQQVLAALAQGGETPADSSSASLARAATRMEVKNPGSLNKIFSNGLGTGGTVLASLAAGFIGSAVWSTLTGGDGIGGRAGLLSRLFGGGRRNMGGLFGGNNMPGNFAAILVESATLAEETSVEAALAVVASVVIVVLAVPVWVVALAWVVPVADAAALAVAPVVASKRWLAGRYLRNFG